MDELAEECRVRYNSMAHQEQVDDDEMDTSVPAAAPLIVSPVPFAHLMAHLWTLWTFTQLSAWRMRFKPGFPCLCGATFSHAHKRKVYQFTMPSLRHTVLPTEWNITAGGPTTVTYQGLDGTCRMQLVVTSVGKSPDTDLSVNATKFVVFNDGTQAPYLNMSFLEGKVGVIQVEMRFQWTNSPVRLLVVNRLYLAAKIAQMHGCAPPALQPKMLQDHALFPDDLHSYILPADTEGLLVGPLPPPPLLYVQVPDLYEGAISTVPQLVRVILPWLPGQAGVPPGS
jgi:hypothetical protein